jgi:hypothetical protein
VRWRERGGESGGEREVERVVERESRADASGLLSKKRKLSSLSHLTSL